MRVVIFEPGTSGHRLQYARVVAQAIAPLGVELLLALAENAADTAEFRTHLADLTDPANPTPGLQVQCVLPAVRGPSLRIARGNLGSLRHIVRRLRPDHVCLPTADGLVQVMGVARLLGRNPLGKTEGEALLMRGRFAEGGLAPWASWLAASAAPLATVHILDPFHQAAIQRRGGGLARRCRLIPEPVEPLPVLGRRDCRRRLGLPDDGRYLGCLGRLDARKGIDLLLRAFAQAPLADHDRLLLMGVAEPEVRQLLEGPYAQQVRRGRIVHVDRYVAQDQFALGLGAMDVVCAPYPRHLGSSGIVVRAAAAQRMLFSSDTGWIGTVTRRFGLGRVCRVQDVAAFAAALGPALDASAGFALGEAGRRFTQYHTLSNTMAHWTVRLRQRLGLDPPPQMLSWDWVLQATGEAPDSANR